MLNGPRVVAGLHMPGLTAGNLFLITAIFQSVSFGLNQTGSLPDFLKSSKGQFFVDLYSLSATLLFSLVCGRLALPVAKSTHSPETRSCRNSFNTEGIYNLKLKNQNAKLQF